jgi:hypothetical protein
LALTGACVPTGHLARSFGSAAAASSVISPVVSNRHNPTVNACRQRRISSVTAANTCDGSPPWATRIATRRKARSSSSSHPGWDNGMESAAERRQDIAPPGLVEAVC